MFHAVPSSGTVPQVSVPEPETTGERVARQRRRLKLGVRELAAKAGITAATVSNVEAGKSVRGDTLTRIAEALGVSLEWLRDGRA
jgi:transcriptional regulator with XRE-family HTH domain